MAEFPDLQPNVLEVAAELQSLITSIFPAAVVSEDEENVGFGFGSGYKDLVFVISPQSKYVNLGIVNGAILDDPHNLMKGKGKVHRHVKLHRVEQVQDPDLMELIRIALKAAQERIQKGS